MPIAAGRLRHRVTIEKRIEVNGQYGAPEVVWQAIKTVWASVRAQKGREIVEADQRLGETTYEVVIRQRDINNTYRLTWQNYIFDIREVRIDNVPGRLVLICTEGTTEG